MKISRLPSILLALALVLVAPRNAAAESEVIFTEAELDQILAPIALYPDVLLSQILMASTYPLEVVTAARWSRDNNSPTGDEALQLLGDRDWDPSVVSLAAFPTVLEHMDENLEWMQQLGEAFLAQEEDVANAIQRLRHKAHEAGNLNTTTHLKVERREEVIIIEPTDIRTVYVPYYSTRVIYGDWWWPHYPPVYWAPPPGFYYSIGFHFGRGSRISTGFYYSNFCWSRRNVVVVNVHRHYPRHTYHTIVRTGKYGTHYSRWHHNPVHRRGVSYRHADLNRRYTRDSASGRISPERVVDTARSERRTSRPSLSSVERQESMAQRLRETRPTEGRTTSHLQRPTESSLAQRQTTQRFTDRSDRNVSRPTVTAGRQLDRSVSSRTSVETRPSTASRWQGNRETGTRDNSLRNPGRGSSPTAPTARTPTTSTRPALSENRGSTDRAGWSATRDSRSSTSSAQNPSPPRVSTRDAASPSRAYTPRPARTP